MSLPRLTTRQVALLMADTALERGGFVKKLSRRSPGLYRLCELIDRSAGEKAAKAAVMMLQIIDRATEDAARQCGERGNSSGEPVGSIEVSA